MTTADQPPIIPLWPNGAPDSEGWTQQEQETLAPPPIGIRVVRNVTQPTLTAFLPDDAETNRAAVIICPGGAFHFLAIEHEGTKVSLGSDQLYSWGGLEGVWGRRSRPQTPSPKCNVRKNLV